MSGSSPLVPSIFKTLPLSHRVVPGPNVLLFLCVVFPEGKTTIMDAVSVVATDLIILLIFQTDRVRSREVAIWLVYSLLAKKRITMRLY